MQDFHYIHILCKNANLIKSGFDFCSVNSAGALTGLNHIFSFSIGYT